MSDFWLVLKAWLGILADFLGSFYADHVRFDLSHPYRASTDALIGIGMVPSIMMYGAMIESFVHLLLLLLLLLQVA